MLSEKDTLLLWQYADGTCTEAEARQLEARLAQEPPLQQAWAEIQVLQANLQAVEPDQPSLRFTKNVLEQLPPATQRLERIRLLSPTALWRWAAGIGLAIVAAILFLPTGTVEGPGAVSQFLRPMEGKLQEPINLFERLPLTWILAVCLAFILVLSLDQVLQARLKKQPA